MTLEEAVELLQELNERTDGRTVKVSVGGMTGDLTRAEWRYGDLVLVADAPDAGTPGEPVAARSGQDG